MAPAKNCALITVALAVALLAMVVEAQQTQECASKLVACAEYLNSTNPAPSCCNAISEVVKTQLDCLCKLYQTPGLLASMGINVTQALQLPKYCKIPGDVSACNAVSPTLSPPSAVAGGKDKNGVGRRISSVGMPSLLLLATALVFY